MNQNEVIDAIASQHDRLPCAHGARIVDSVFAPIDSEIKTLAQFNAGASLRALLDKTKA